MCDIVYSILCNATPSKNRVMLLLILDEVDKAPVNLVEKLLHSSTLSSSTEKQSVGSTSKSKHKDGSAMSGALASNLLFVGIANSLNYPNEVRLTALHAKPATVLFVPYSNSSLYGMLKERCSNLVHDSAVSFPTVPL